MDSLITVEYIEKGVELAERLDNEEYQLLLEINRGFSLIYKGYPEPSKILAQKVLEKSRQRKFHLVEGWSLRLLGEVFTILSDSMALAFMDSSLVLAQQIQNEDLEWRVLADRGLFHFHRLNKREAIKNFLMSWNILSKKPDDRFDPLYYLGLSYVETGELEKAHEVALQGLEVAEIKRSNHARGAFLRVLGYYHSAQGNLDQSNEYYTQSHAAYVEAQVPEGIHFIEFTTGLKHYKQGNFESAIQHFQKSLPFLNRYDLSDAYLVIIKCRVLNNQVDAVDHPLKLLRNLSEKYHHYWPLFFAEGHVGMHLTEQGRYSKALIHLDRMLEISEKDGAEESWKEFYYSRLSEIYQKQGHFSEALTYKQKALDFARLSENSHRIANRLQHLAELYIDLENWPKVIEYATEAEEIYNSLGGSRCPISHSHCYLGLAYLKKSQLDSAVLFLKNSLEKSSECGTSYIDLQIRAALYLGQAYEMEGMVKSATSMYELAIEVASTIKYRSYIMEAAERLYLLYEQQGMLNQAYQTFKVFQATADSLFNEENIRTIAQLEAENRFQKERDSIQFNNQIEKLRLSQTIEKQRTTQTAAIAGIIILIFFVYVLYRYYRSKQKSNMLLRLQRDEIEKKNLELSSLDQAKSRFFANLSHELRTPLTLIGAPLQKVAEEKMMPSSMKGNIEVALANTDKLRGLVDDILALSKLESNTVESKSRTVDIYSFLNRVSGSFQSMAEHLDIELLLNLELPDTHVSIDSKKLEKVLNNLLSNAIKHTKSGGKVELLAFKKNDRLIIRVIDDGPGIASEDLHRIFDRYYQSKQPDAPIQGGTGIGLALAKEYSKLMNGDLTVTSKEGVGSTFTLDIPYRQSEAVEAIPAEKLEKEAVEDEFKQELRVNDIDLSDDHHHILIVEDHPEMQQFIKQLLGERYQITTAVHGKQALSCLENQIIDLVVSDVMMPEMDGFELLQTLRESEKFQAIPVIMLTALAEEEHRLKALHIGVDEYLPKPFSPQELLARVSNMLERYEVRKSLKSSENEESVVSDSDGIDGQGGMTGDQVFIREVEELILMELENEDFRLEEAADHFHLGERQFRHKVTKITGLSPKKYQREVALQKARELFETEAYDNLSAVAYTVGIRNATRFSEYYKSRFGKDPRSYFLQYS